MGSCMSKSPPSPSPSDVRDGEMVAARQRDDYKEIHLTKLPLPENRSTQHPPLVDLPPHL